MKSMSKRVAQLQQTKARNVKQKRHATQSLKSVKSLHRKSASSINSIQRRVSKFRSELDEISSTLQHSLAQKESIQRLKINAEERLKQEKELKKQVEQELSSAANDAKEQLEFTLVTITNQINEIRNEIRQRNSTAKKAEKIIQECSTKKSRLSTQVRRTLESKPHLTKIMNNSKKNITKLEKRLPSLIKTGKNVQENISKINSIMREEVKRRKANQAKRKAARKPKAKRKAARKPKAKRKAARKRR